MAKFVTSLGDQIDIPDHDGKFARVLIQRIYDDEDKQDRNGLMQERFQNCTDEKYESRTQLYNFESGESYWVTDTYIVVTNPDYKDLPTADYYTTQASNTQLKHKIEIILQREEWKKQVFYEWRGNATFFDMVRDIADTLWESFDEEPNRYTGIRPSEDSNGLELMMWTAEGEFDYIPVENERDFETMIVSVRVVELEEKFLEFDPETKQYVTASSQGEQNA